MPPEPGTEPVYQRLADLLAGLIDSRALRPGDRVPSLRHFSRLQRVSLPTAMQAYATLETRGLIEARPKAGYFVRARQADALDAPSAPASRPRITDFAGLDPLDATLADQADPQLVQLGAAVAALDLLPVRALARTMAALNRRSPGAAIAYDVVPGAEPLRREIARRSLEWGCRLTPADLVITTGCTEAISLALDATCRPGDTVLVEAPTYFGLARTLRDRGLRALPVPVDATNGLLIEKVEQVLRRTRVAAAVVIPNFNNPVGSLMPDDAKRALVDLLVGRGIAVIEDDIYGDLQHEGDRPRCLKAFDRNDGVILCGSFSKTLAPGYRVGYIAAGRWHDRVRSLKRAQSLASATLPALTVASFLRDGGYDRHLRRMRRGLRDQVARVREAVARAFPEGVAISRPQGGFVLWCELPPPVDALSLFKQARRAGIAIAPGPIFGPDGGFDRCIRLNCGHRWSPQLERSIGTLGALVHKALRSRR
jgi:DNA-binding transcriptional MocR family regulator